jgi:hypothetical protein
MSMMVVTAVAFDSTFKTAMQQFIEMYFDGGTHLIASTLVSFPCVSSTFNRPILDRPLEDNVARINFQQLPSPPQEFRQNNLRQKVEYQILVITNDPSGKFQDWASDCLGVIFTQCRDILAQSGIKVERVGNPVAWADPSHEYGVVQRVVGFLVELPGAARNWNWSG